MRWLIFLAFISENKSTARHTIPKAEMHALPQPGIPGTTAKPKIDAADAIALTQLFISFLFLLSDDTRKRVRLLLLPASIFFDLGVSLWSYNNYLRSHLLFIIFYPAEEHLTHMAGLTVPATNSTPSPSYSISPCFAVTKVTLSAVSPTVLSHHQQ